MHGLTELRRLKFFFESFSIVKSSTFRRKPNVYGQNMCSVYRECSEFPMEENKVLVDFLRLRSLSGVNNWCYSKISIIVEIFASIRWVL